MKQLQENTEKLLNEFIRDFYERYRSTKIYDSNQIQSYFNGIKIKGVVVKEFPVAIAAHCNHTWIHFLLFDMPADKVAKTSTPAVVVEVKITGGKISKIQLRPGKGSVVTSSDFSEGLFDVFLNLQLFLNNERK